MTQPSQLTLDVRPGEHLLFDDGRIIVEVLEKSGKTTRVRVTAPRDVAIKRGTAGADAPRAMRDSMQPS